ncbi:MAG: N-acetylmuramoyl-L-alanine amidase [Deltaproteobacteria bacterium]|nr:N-acetylmuramoyl-L-alanine amidase [Deltaproteobacteria bacterium]
MPKRTARFLAIAASIAAIACGGRGGSGADAGDASDQARATRLAIAGSELPPRPEAIALAQSVEAAALKEGAGARAVELHALAAQLHERIWRIEHREQDAKEALDLYRAASRDLALPGACEAAARGAKLAGEVAKDAQTTYAELYRVHRRATPLDADAGSAPGACGKPIDDVLAALGAFRPAPAVLDAIDQGLAGEGAIALASVDAGTVSVAPRLTRIEQWTGAEGARVVVHLDRPARFRVGDQASKRGQPARTYVELDGVDLGGPGKTTPLGGIVQRIVAEPTTTGSRVALDLDGPAYRRVFHLLEPFRVVIDIARQPPGGGPRGTGRTVARVAIDPGHGGNDPGASGPTGLKEKEVTLAIAQKLAPVLARQGIEVAVTRDDDRYVTLEERTARANAFGADLFVSIHCNASESRGRKGIETYILDTTANEMAGKVAARENGASQAASNEVAQLLASMRLADQATRSTRLAELLQKSAIASIGSQYVDVVDGGVHHAGFYVLVGARMPAVIFETSYISNPVEEQRLGSAEYQQRLADAVANAIKAFKEGR